MSEGESEKNYVLDNTNTTCLRESQKRTAPTGRDGTLFIQKKGGLCAYYVWYMGGYRTIES